MTITKIFIAGFGRLINFSYELNDGLNVICAGNGWGKSTLASFVKACFYGFDRNANRTSDGQNPRKLFKPWRGGTMGGFLEILHDGIPYRIERTFGETKKTDTLKVTNLLTNKPTDQLGTDETLGMTLMGLDETAFERCLYIGQGSLIVDDKNASLSAKLTSSIDNSEELTNLDAALKKLTDFSSSIVRRGGNGIADNIKKEIRETNDKLQTAIMQAKEISQLNQKLLTLKTTVESLSAAHAKQCKDVDDALEASGSLSELDMFNLLQQNSLRAQEQLHSARGDFLKIPDEEFVANCKTLKSDVACIKEQTQECSRLAQEKKQNLEQLKGKEKKNKSSVFLFLSPLPVALLLFALAFVLPQLKTFGIAGGGVFLFSVLVQLVFPNSWLKKLKSLKTFKEESVQLSKQLFALSSELETLRTKEEAATRAIGFVLKPYLMHKDLFTANDLTLAAERAEMIMVKHEAAKYAAKQFDEHKAKIDRDGLLAKQSLAKNLPQLKILRDETSATLENAKRSFAHYEAQLIHLVEEQIPKSEPETQLTALNEQLEIWNNKFEAAKLAKDCLLRAKTNLAGAFVPKLSQTLSGLTSFLTDGVFSSAVCDESFNLTIMEDGGTRELSYFSLGLKQLFLFCLRLGLTEIVYGKVPPLLVIDDAFVNMDLDKQKKAVSLLKEKAKTTQIVYFTCHKGLQELFNP